MNIKHTKIANIQHLRGLAIIAVIIIHSNMLDLLRVTIRPFVNYAVALFLFLSGYLTKLNIDNTREFFSRRIKKVVIPYIIWSVIFYVTDSRESIADFVIKLLTGQCCGIYYYIFVYIQFVLLTPIISKLIKSKHLWIGWWITPITTFIARYIAFLLGVTTISSNFKYTFFAWFIYYYLGMALGNGIIQPKENLRKYTLFYIASIVLSLIEGYAWYEIGSLDMATTQLRLTSILTSVSFLLCCYWYIINYKKSNIFTDILNIIGNCSFGIYLSHVLVQSFFENNIPQYMFFPLNFLLVLIFTTMLVSIGNSILKKYSWILGF